MQYSSPMLSSDDKNSIVRLVSGIVKVDIDALRKELNAKIDTLPTKEYFSKRMDELSGEIKKVREEQIIHSGDHSQINDRFGRIDKHLGISTAA